MIPTQIGGYGSMIPLPRRGGGGVERGGDACIALGGAFFACNPRFVLEPPTMMDWTMLNFSGKVVAPITCIRRKAIE